MFSSSPWVFVFLLTLFYKSLLFLFHFLVYVYRTESDKTIQIIWNGNVYTQICICWTILVHPYFLYCFCFIACQKLSCSANNFPEGGVENDALFRFQSKVKFTCNYIFLWLSYLSCKKFCSSTGLFCWYFSPPILLEGKLPGELCA